MKKLILILILLSSNLFGMDFKADYSLQTQNESDNTNWTFSTEISNDLLDVMYQIERENNQTFINYITTLDKGWKYFELTAKRTYFEKQKNQIYLQATGRYPVVRDTAKFIVLDVLTDGYWELGFRQAWDYNIPSSNLVIGKSYQKKLKFFLTPATFEYKINFATDNFSYWKRESEVTLKFKLLASLQFYLKYLFEEDWIQLRSGFEFSY